MPLLSSQASTVRREAREDRMKTPKSQDPTRGANPLNDSST
ncbi:uncharacterized protein G2W53_012802 [Senna tora]|uniref:Uncharacterized protein n=1 Tax=Senna tora TaxID=362788 RepID=A0A834TYN8_9FABA|nr:uncharacterized protein G2W53_012802 [Senna tora]